MSEIVTLAAEHIDDGLAIHELNEKLRHVAQDVLRREDISKPRKVTLVIEVMPVEDSFTGETMLDVNWKIGHSIPGSKGSITRAFLKNGEFKIRRRPKEDDQPLLAETENKLISLNK